MPESTQPPSMLLLHELGHAYHHDSNPKEFEDMKATTDMEYGDEVERWVIENIESPAAIRLGITPRTSHSGLPLPVGGPNVYYKYFK